MIGDSGIAQPPSPDGNGGFHLFVYGTLRSDGAAREMLAGCERVGTATVDGTLYDIDGRFPALMLYGGTPVQGEVWRCPVDRLQRIDEYEGVGRGLFRRVAVMAAGLACWTYVAGPALARELTPARRVLSGTWSGAGAP
jgi:gamma-glutamylcyclotransferase (GGCT)/AIG2-like uncharacterized protein YtfP